MKKKSSKKLQLDKLKIASLSNTSQQERMGGAKTSPISVCICAEPTITITNCLPSWCTENC